MMRTIKTYTKKGRPFILRLPGLESDIREPPSRKSSVNTGRLLVTYRQAIPGYRRRRSSQNHRRKARRFSLRFCTSL